jgi:histidine decarboxylase
MASPAVQLASSCALPAAVSHSHDVHNVQATDDSVGRNQRLKQGNGNVQIAPYQALPVAGPIITHHKATALDVQELSPEMSEEVGRLVSVGPTCVCGSGDWLLLCMSC